MSAREHLQLQHSWTGSIKASHGNSHWVLVLTIFILCVAASGFACGIRGLPTYYQVLVAIMPTAAVALLWLTHLTDPGIIPPAAEKDPIALLLEDGNVDGVPDASKYSRDPHTFVWQRTVPYRDGTLIEKYCVSCNIWRPPRASHCATCGHCMEHFDHHCEVVGNCIAKNNHRFFTGFLMTAQAGSGLLLGGAVWRLQQLPLDSPEGVVVIILAVVYAYTALMLIFGNVHCLFLMCDLTSKECATQNMELRHNPPCLPGNRNPMYLLANLRSMCCAPVQSRPQHSSRYPSGI